MCGTMRQEEPPVRAAGLVADVAAARQHNPDMGIKKLVRLIKMTHPDVSAKEVREALAEAARNASEDAATDSDDASLSKQRPNPGTVSIPELRYRARLKPDRLRSRTAAENFVAEAEEASKQQWQASSSSTGSISASSSSTGGISASS